MRRLLSSGWEIRSLLVTDDKIDRLDDVGGDSGPFPRYYASRAVVEEVLGFDLHRGVIASAVRPEPRDWRAVASSATRLAVLEGINDHENLGAIFRSAAALGVGGLLLAPTVPDPLYRRSAVRWARSSWPYARMESWPQTLRIAAMVHPIALTRMHGGLIASIDSPRPHSCWAGVVRLSNGGHGCSHCAVRIGQTGTLDSLNVVMPPP